MLIDDIKNGETDQLEVKEVPNRDSAKWLKTVVAFANGRGGRIVFGVANDRRVIGLKGNIIEDWGSGIPRICGDIKKAGLRGLEISAWPNAERSYTAAKVQNLTFKIQNKTLKVQNWTLEARVRTLKDLKA